MGIHHRRAGPSQYEPAAIDRIIGAVTATGRIRAKGTVTVTLVSKDGGRRRCSIDARAALSERLWAAAYDYLLVRSNAGHNPASARTGYFDRIEKAADRLVAALAPYDEDHNEHRFPGEDWLSVGVPDLPYDDFDMMAAATWIRDAARAGRQDVAGRVGAKDPHEGDVAMQQLIRDLAVIYRDIFGRAAGVKKDPYKQGKRGPFFRFCRAAIDEINRHEDDLVGIHLKDGALAARIQRMG